MKVLQVTLRLQKIQHLFDDPDITPYSEYYQPYSTKAGMEYIIEELYAHPESKSIKLTVLLPPEQITSNLENTTSKAINKYSDAWAQDAKHKMSRAKYRGTRGLLSALAALIFLDGTAIWLSSFPNMVLTLLSESLIVAAWVLMWYPVDALTQELWVYRLEKKSYQALKNIHVVIKPDNTQAQDTEY